MDFQLRPTNPDHLWYAHNVLDWPFFDDAGQVKDTYPGTFFDREPFDNNGDGKALTPDDNGDTKLVPMLEIQFSESPYHLPLTSTVAVTADIQPAEWTGVPSDPGDKVPPTNPGQLKIRTFVRYALRE